MERLGRGQARLLIGAGLLAAGAVLLLVSWGSIRDETEVAIQMPYVLTGGIGALMLTVLAAVVLRSQSDGPARERLAEVEATNHDLKERVDYLTQLLEAALLPDQAITVPEASTRRDTPDATAARATAR